MMIKTLLVDDERTLLEQAQIFLERDEDIEAETVSSAEKALELMDEENFDLIVSDYKMPGMDGLEFLEELREERESDIPFIMFTGKGREEVAMKALNLGADRYIQKGGSPESQYKVLAQAIKQERTHKDTQKELKRKNTTLSSIFEHLPTIVMVVDADRRVKTINHAGLEFVNKSRDEILDQRGGEALRCLNRLKHPDGCGFSEECEECVIRNAVLDTFETGEGHYREKGTLPFESAEGEKKVTFWVTTALLEFEDDERVLVTIEDITELESIKEDLRESEERYRRLFETAQDGMLIIDAETGKIEDANPFIQDILGYSKEELVGKQLWQLGTFKSVVENKKRFEELVEEGYIRYEDKPLVTKDGKEVPVEFVSNSYEAGGKKVVQCNIREISERKKAEKREEFLHSLLRHDVKNKNQIVKGYLELIRDYDIPDEVKDVLDKAEYTVEKSSEIIEKVRTLREIDQKEQIVEINLNSVLDKVLSEYQDQLEEKDIKLNTEDCDQMVKGGSLLEALFSNLISNSVQHTDCDEIRISSRNEGDGCVVTVEDDGTGIPDDLKHKIFERGYKKGENAGTGLGLYMVKKIAESYGGSVEVKDSELGGARFDITLLKAE